MAGQPITSVSPRLSRATSWVVFHPPEATCGLIHRGLIALFDAGKLSSHAHARRGGCFLACRTPAGRLPKRAAEVAMWKLWGPDPLALPGPLCAHGSLLAVLESGGSRQGSRERKLSFDSIYQTIDRTLHELTEFLYFRHSDEMESTGAQIKIYHDDRGHRLKTVRPGILDVTYGFKVLPSVSGGYFIEASVNNKIAEFDIHDFVHRLASFYFTESLERPWTQQPFRDLSYGDFLLIEPEWGTTVSLDTQEGRAEVIRVLFAVKPKYFHLLEKNPVRFRQLLLEFCYAPLRRIYAEIYRPGAGGSTEGETV